MFVAQAHSFTQQARLAITLAWVAGYTNLMTVLTCGTVTSHVSGTTSTLGRDAAEGNYTLAAFGLYLLATFALGAGVSGVCTEMGRRRGWTSIYVLPMAVEALLLAVFAIGVEFHDPASAEAGIGRYWMTGVAAGAMGLQNATISRISSGAVRTTHVTGVLSDLGMETAQMLFWLIDKRRDFPPGKARALVRSVHAHPTARRLALLASIVGSFALGAALSTLAYDHIKRFAMFPPVLFLVWIIVQDLSRPIAELAPVQNRADLMLPDELAVFHLSPPGKRGRRQAVRMPNLLAWADRLPEQTRVVVLDVGDTPLVDANAAMEVRAVLSRFSATGRRLVIAGIDQSRFAQLQAAGAGVNLTPEDACPDLELAIARGLNLLSESALERA